MYIHGGGFVSGSAVASKGYSSMLMEYSGYKVIAVNYYLVSKYSFSIVLMIVSMFFVKS